MQAQLGNTIAIGSVDSAPVKDKPYDNIPFTRYDAGWVVLCIGMALGSGIVFLPVQIGLKGMWVFAVATLFAYPAVYLFQTLYLKTLSNTEQCEDYASIIAQYLGKNWGAFLGCAYFLMLLHGMLIYSLAITFDSASYLQTFNISNGLLSDRFWYGLIVMSIMVLIASQGERLLFKVAGPMVVVKFGVVIVLAFVMIPHWNMANVSGLPEAFPFLRDTLLTLPFAIFSIIFVQIINPMNIAFRKQEADPRIATYRTIRAHRIAFAVLATAILFFALSFSLSLSHEKAVEAYEQNISALAIAAQVIPGPMVATMTFLLNVFATATAFFGIYLGFQEAVVGIVLNILTRFVPQERINRRVLNIAIGVFIVLALWMWVLFRFRILFLWQIAAPLYAIVSCLIPCYLVYKVPVLRNLKGPSTYFIIFIGIMVCLSPFFIFFE